MKNIIKRSAITFTVALLIEILFTGQASLVQADCQVTASSGDEFDTVTCEATDTNGINVGAG